MLSGKEGLITNIIRNTCEKDCIISKGVRTTAI